MLLQRKYEKRDASSTSLTANVAPGCARITLDAIQELRAHEHTLERALNPALEAPFGAPAS